MRILVVEESRSVADTLTADLENEGYEPTVVATGGEALVAMRRQTFALAVLGFPLDGCDMCEMLAEARRQNRGTRLLVISRSATLENCIRALNAGADGYMARPVAFIELKARIQALLRRACRSSSKTIGSGDLSMDIATRSVKRSGRAIKLTPRESALLEYLLQHKEQVVTRSALGWHIWKKTAAGKSMRNLIDVHLASLRRKIDHAHPDKLIHTVRGQGFVMRDI